MASSWAMRRKILYTTTVFVLLLGALTVAYFVFFKNPPTCFDGKKNGEETGEDCGGGCRLLCSAENIPLVVDWARFFEVRRDVRDTGSQVTYTVFALVENPNKNAYIPKAPYTFSVYNKQGEVIATKSGVTTVPPGQSFGVLESDIILALQASTTPTRVSITFDDSVSYEKYNILTGVANGVSRMWHKSERPVVIDNVQFSQLNPPRVTGSVRNITVHALPKVEVAAVLYGTDGNAVGVSRTVLDSLGPEASKDVNFTWPKSFDNLARACEIPTDSLLLIDRSGSMDDDGANPPQPLTGVLNAAQTYIQKIGMTARTGIISFATESSVEQVLSSVAEDVKNAINNISIGTNGIQHTNAYSALSKAFEIYTNPNTNDRVAEQKIVILLTDGVVTRPQNPNNIEDETYAERMTIEAAEQLKKQGVIVYTIGLGSAINDTFMQKVASKPEYYFKAPDTAAVERIYTSIASSVCVQTPLVRLFPRILE